MSVLRVAAIQHEIVWHDHELAIELAGERKPAVFAYGGGTYSPTGDGRIGKFGGIVSDRFTYFTGNGS